MKTSEFADLYISIVIVEHIGCINGVLWDVTACDGEVEQFLFRKRLTPNFTLVLFGPFRLRMAFRLSAFACKKTVVDHYNAVAIRPTFLGRSAGNHAVYVSCLLEW